MQPSISFALYNFERVVVYALPSSNALKSKYLILLFVPRKNILAFKCCCSIWTWGRFCAAQKVKWNI